MSSLNCSANEKRSDCIDSHLCLPGLQHSDSAESIANTRAAGARAGFGIAVASAGQDFSAHLAGRYATMFELYRSGLHEFE
jgi:hypothetical protein